jgi:predicted extracellular nuclease
MKKKYFLLFGMVLLTCGNLFSQVKKDFLIVSYNVENLFDTIDDPNKMDEEFLPTAKKKWNTESYLKKLKNISKVIGAVDSSSFPAVVALCEVENKQVLLDLLATAPLNKSGYSIVHFESIDPRGIDDALLYRPEYFKPLVQKNFIMDLPLNGKPFHHDFLYVKGVAGSDTLHFFVNHWKSRAPQSDSLKNVQKRVLEATFLKSKTDSISKANPNAKIIILGDFNDTPLDESILNALKASGSKPSVASQLYNPFYDPAKNAKGSYYYKGTWYMFDQIIVSGALVTGKGPKYDPLNFGVFSPDWMMYTNKIGNTMPSKYYSDHLPVFIWLKKK